jgi:hypothetical protein
MAMAIYSASEIRRNHFPHICEAGVPLWTHEIAVHFDPQTRAAS